MSKKLSTIYKVLGCNIHLKLFEEFKTYRSFVFKNSEYFDRDV